MASVGGRGMSRVGGRAMAGVGRCGVSRVGRRAMAGVGGCGVSRVGRRALAGVGRCGVSRVGRRALACVGGGGVSGVGRCGVCGVGQHGTSRVGTSSVAGVRSHRGIDPTGALAARWGHRRVGVQLLRDGLPPAGGGEGEQNRDCRCSHPGRPITFCATGNVRRNASGDDAICATPANSRTPGGSLGACSRGDPMVAPRVDGLTGSTPDQVGRQDGGTATRAEPPSDARTSHRYYSGLPGCGPRAPRPFTMDEASARERSVPPSHRPT
jgi:hypothetical protein